MTEGKIVSWIKSKGDKLSKGESVVVVVESGKADMDVETFDNDYMAAVMVEKGFCDLEAQSGGWSWTWTYGEELQWHQPAMAVRALAAV